MKQISEIDSVRQQATLSSMAGFPFLLVFAFAWSAAALLTYLVPEGISPWVYPFMGIPAMPIAMALERRLGYVRATKPDPLLPLILQIVKKLMPDTRTR